LFGSVVLEPVTRQNIMVGACGGSKLLTYDSQEAKRKREEARVPISPSRVSLQ
jgi:hypothetical protein